MGNSNNIRKQIQKKRKELPKPIQQEHALSLASRVAEQPVFLKSQNIAAYIPVNGEMDPFPLIYRSWELGKTVFLPVLIPYHHNRLWFAPFHPDSKLINNRFGIPEPVIQKRRIIPPYALDLVLTPLVAFDPQCNRMGMGGGYYDRTFAFLRHRKQWIKPRLLGMAYELQSVNNIKKQKWDVPLWGVATETNLYIRK